MTLLKYGSRTVAWTLWIIASIFYAYQYILRVIPSIMLEDIIEQFGMNSSTFGQFSGVYYIGYSLMHLPIGIMLDRFGPRKVMTGCMILTVIGLMPLLFNSHFIYPIIGRLFIGIGSSAAILGVFKIIRITFHQQYFSRLLSLSVAIGVFGAIYGGGPVNYMKDLFGHQSVIQLLSASGIVLAIITYLIVPDLKNPPSNPVFSDIKEVISNRKVLSSCLFAGLMVGPLEGFADVWGSTFLKQVYGFENSLATSLPSMIFLGMCFGAPILNWIAEKIKSHLAAIVGAGILMSLCFGLLLCTTLRPSVITFNFIVVGACCAYQILAIYKASTYVREQVAGLTVAIANMIIMIFGYAFHSAIGYIVNLMGGPNTSAALFCGISIIPIGLVLGLFGFSSLWIQERIVKNKRIQCK